MAPYVQSVEKQARTVNIEVDFLTAKTSRMLPGYSADIEVILKEQNTLVGVPTGAMLEGNDVLCLPVSSYQQHNRKRTE